MKSNVLHRPLSWLVKRQIASLRHIEAYWTRGWKVASNSYFGHRNVWSPLLPEKVWPAASACLLRRGDLRWWRIERLAASLLIKLASYPSHRV